MGAAKLIAHARWTGVWLRGIIVLNSALGDDPWQNFFRRDDPALLVEQTMAWAVLFVAGLLEISWAVGLKYTEGFTRLWPTVGTAVALIASMTLLGIALRTLPLGTAYAVWTGIGTVGTAVLGIVLFREPATVLRLLCIAMIVAGIVGLKLAPVATRAGP